MQFSIITPSFRNSDWLKLCIASVADQQVDCEHIVQDAGSDDGTLDWLLNDPRVKAFVEKDKGMYDGVNRGMRRAKGDILAYLNCDEQYLPGALSAVRRFFQQHPSVEVVFGDVVIVDADGQYRCHRKSQPPLKYHTWTCHLSSLSCAIFFRRRLFFEGGFNFDPHWTQAGDAEWMLRLLREGISMASLNRFSSIFTARGDNMSRGAAAKRENRELARTAPFWARAGKPVIILHHRLRRLVMGSYSQEAFSYELYTLQSPHQRVLHRVEKPTFRYSNHSRR